MLVWMFTDILVSADVVTDCLCDLGRSRLLRIYQVRYFEDDVAVTGRAVEFVAGACADSHVNVAVARCECV